jgi:WD domain, G-beta repeat
MVSRIDNKSHRCGSAAGQDHGRLPGTARAVMRPTRSGHRRPGCSPDDHRRRLRRTSCVEIRAKASGLTDPAVMSMLATVQSQAHNLRAPWPVTQPGYGLRQLCLQAMELGQDPLAAAARARLEALADPVLIPLMTTRRSTPGAGQLELGRHDWVKTVEVLADGRVVSAGGDGRLLIWNPATPGADPIELGHHRSVRAVAVLPDGRVISGGADERVLIWEPAAPGTDPIELVARQP